MNVSYNVEFCTINLEMSLSLGIKIISACAVGSVKEILLFIALDCCPIFIVLPSLNLDISQWFSHQILTIFFCKTTKRRILRKLIMFCW